MLPKAVHIKLQKYKLCARQSAMDERTERRRKERILRSLAEGLTSHGFTRTKRTWYARLNGGAAEFIHVHKFTFGPHFRMHAGRRLVNDDSENVALNGPDSEQVQDWRYLLVFKRKYDLTFAADPKSVDLCVRRMIHFCAKVAEPWFQKQREDSPPTPAEPSEATQKLLRLDKIAQQDAAHGPGTAGAEAGQ